MSVKRRTDQFKYIAINIHGTCQFLFVRKGKNFWVRESEIRRTVTAHEARRTAVKISTCRSGNHKFCAKRVWHSVEAMVANNCDNKLFESLRSYRKYQKAVFYQYGLHTNTYISGLTTGSVGGGKSRTTNLLLSKEKMYKLL